MTFLAIPHTPVFPAHVHFRRLIRGWKNEHVAAGLRFWRTFRAEILAGIAVAAVVQIAVGTGLL